MEQIRCTHVGAGTGFDHLSYVTVAKNWANSSGKLAVYSSFTMHMYSGRHVLLFCNHRTARDQLLARAGTSDITQMLSTSRGLCAAA